jgi:hypothetical protein
MLKRHIISACMMLAASSLFVDTQCRADEVNDALAGKIGQGTTSEGIKAIESFLITNPGDDRALFSLGLMQLLQGWESVSQGLYRYGAGGPLRQSAGLVLPIAGLIPANPDPEPVAVDDVRAMFLEGIESLKAADQTLAKIDDDFYCSTDILAIRMDFNGDGIASDKETVLGVLSTTRVRLRNPDTNTPMTKLLVDFDRGDAEWLRGYCNLSMALDEYILAHDFSELFNKAGHVFFPEPVSEYTYLRSGKSPFEQEKMYTGGIDPLDIVSFIHLLRFPVAQPERLEKVQNHLLAAIGHSRAMWSLYNNETDNTNEWIPNTMQTAALPGAMITEDAYKSWIQFLDASQNILEGNTLLPFWRGDGSLGVDINAYFEKPTEFDLILFFQGSAAHPYLKEGEMLDPKVWEDMERAFNRHSFRHMFWIN